ncbi:MAG: zf-HC2 domain-containing protein [Vicinamibacterales bacterium]
MCNHERLLDYLYDELPASDRAAFELHLRECVDCQTELSDLGGTRLALAAWSPPDSELGFKIIREQPSGRRRSLGAFRPFDGLRAGPAWGLAAAAILVLAVAAAISNIELRYGNDGLVVRTGWNKSASVQAARDSAAATVPVSLTSEEWASRLRLLDQRLQQLEQRERRVQAATLPGEPQATASGGMSDAELLRTFRRIIAESETRQQRELAMRLTQVVREFDATRAGDLARIEQGLRQVQGLTDAELIRHRDTLNHLLRVTQQR